MARYVLPTSDASARATAPSDASSNVQPPTPAREAANRSALENGRTERGSAERDVAEHDDITQSVDGATRTAAAPQRAPFMAPPAAPLPTEYRGKSSGEFQRVVSGSAPDANTLIAQAERHLLTLAPSDRNRRLLEVAILRRDTALLNGLLEVFRRQER
jgi:hypothetical protein